MDIHKVWTGKLNKYNHYPQFIISAGFICNSKQDCYKYVDKMIFYENAKNCNDKYVY